MLKMPLVLFEGVDEVGKTSTIKQICKEHYLNSGKKYSVLSYPTSAYWKNTMSEDFQKYDRNNLSEVIDHHYSFMEDFAIHQDSLKKYIKYNDVILLDRYFYSNFAYLQYDFYNYCGDKLKEDHNLLLTYYYNLCKILEGLYSELIQPDLVIYLYNPKPNKETIIIQACYRAAFIVHPPKDIVEIKALQPDTFQKVETVLKTRGYL
jgi:thymidylate kinase